MEEESVARRPRPAPEPPVNRVAQYLRLIAASMLVAVAIGFYLDVIGRIQMTPFTAFEFVVRGALIGAILWAFEIFYLAGPGRSRLARMTAGGRLTVRVVAYLVLFEAGFYIGGFLFHPAETARFLHLTAG